MNLKPYYDQDGITIYHGDCREILPHLPKVDLVLTDPPYGVGLKYESYDDRAGVHWITEALFVLTVPKLITCGVGNVHSYPAPDWILCWHKPNGMTRSRVANANTWEPILVYGCKGFGVDSVTVPIAPQSDTGEHPCPKPLRLFAWLLSKQPSAQTILDPFMGSGTTLVAAKQLGRRAIGIELEKKYCEIAVKRLAQTVMTFDEPREEAKQLALIQED